MQMVAVAMGGRVGYTSSDDVKGLVFWTVFSLCMLLFVVVVGGHAAGLA